MFTIICKSYILPVFNNLGRMLTMEKREKEMITKEEGLIFKWE